MELTEDFYIRESIKRSVDNIQLLDSKGGGGYYKQYGYTDIDNLLDVEVERCFICTLPKGTCEHTSDWILQRDVEKALLEETATARNELEDEINSTLGLLNFNSTTSQIPESRLDDATQYDDVDIASMHWEHLQETLTDKIGSKQIKLFTPDDRGWHTCVSLNNRFLVVFGGFRCKGRIPQPFQTVAERYEVEYLSDLRVYDQVTKCWKGVKAVGPRGRYGHCAAALDESRMIIFGGRAERGSVLGDTWLYDINADTWNQLDSNEASELSGVLHHPSPRFFSAVAAVKGLVYLFGGTNGLENFGDLWVLNTKGSDDASSLYWERIVATGLPPAPRYGHQMLHCAYDSIYHSDLRLTREQQIIQQQHDVDNKIVLIVLGGCAVSPSSEVVGSAMDIDENLALMSMSADLQRKYRKENDLVLTGSKSMEASLTSGGSGALAGQAIARLYEESAQLTGSLHTREQDTRVSEVALVDAYKAAKASAKFKLQRARHPIAHLDLWHLIVSIPHSLSMATTGNNKHKHKDKHKDKDKDIEDDRPDYMHANLLTLSAHWEERRFPKALQRPSVFSNKNLSQGSQLSSSAVNNTQLAGSAAAPSCRMHFCSAVAGKYLFVMGGAHPSSLALRHIDQFGQSANSSDSHQQRRVDTELYVLDMSASMWSKARPLQSAPWLHDLRQLAESDLIRARRQLEAEKARAISLGAGTSEQQLLQVREVAAAHAFVNVCVWRRDALYREGEAARIVSPQAVFGASFTTLGQRLVLIGGWTATPNLVSSISAAYTQTTLLLDVEQELAKRRRMEEEFHAQLEQDRIRIEADTNLHNLVSAYEIRSYILQERLNRERELKEMAVQDFLSSLPPLSRPAPVKLLKANRHTMWLSWNKIYRDSRNRIISSTTPVTFRLFMRSGFQNLQKGDRVLVLPSNYLDFKDSKRGQGQSQGQGQRVRSVQVSSIAALANQLRGSVFDEDSPRFPGLISRVRGDGTFNISYDDGGSEARVPRSRIILAPDIDSDQTSLDMNRPDDVSLLSGTSSQLTVPAITFVKDTRPSTTNNSNTGEEVTVKVGKEWTLVYEGPDINYACCNLASRFSLENEPDLSVPVMFCVQTIGTEYPRYEHSQLSHPVIFFTKTLAGEQAAAMMNDDLLTNDEQEYFQQLGSPNTLTTSQSFNGTGLEGAISKTRKEIITAKLQDNQIIQIERRNINCYSEGVGEDFM